MNRIRNILAAATMAVGLAACSYLQAGYDLATGHSQNLGTAVYTLDQVYVASANFTKGLIDAKLITNKNDLENIRTISGKAHDALAEATQAEKAGANNATVLYNSARAAVVGLQGQLVTLGFTLPAGTTPPDSIPVPAPAPPPASPPATSWMPAMQPIVTG